jgi:YidC/Oxa1 family membrane protein insertase
MEEKQNNIMTYIGMALIFVLLYLWMQYAAPPPKPQSAPGEAVALGKDDDQQADTGLVASPAGVADTPPAAVTAAASGRYGSFAPASVGEEREVVLENDVLRIALTNKGGRIRYVQVKHYEKINVDSAGNDFKAPVYLLEDAKNRFEYILPVNDAEGGKVSTADLFFDVEQQEQSVVFRLDAGDGRFFEQRYALQPGMYALDYQLGSSGLSGDQIQLMWINHLDKLEKNQQYERTMSTVYFKTAEASPDYCDCRSSSAKDLGDQPVQWFSHANQFFNTGLTAQNFSFRNLQAETIMREVGEPDLKTLITSAAIPLQQGSAQMTLYTGPSEFSTLRAVGNQYEDIIPFGASLFGSINRWVIHPLFDFLLKFIHNKGLVIILLTLLVKLILFPLTYRMVYSQSKMAALKPQIEALKKKLGDDQQALSMETMKLYSEFRVNPLGGCLPIFMQMPIWFALYRFFPASIEFRQAGFLWASDLSSFDDVIKLPFYLPAFGNHISLFTLLWVVTTLWYTWYNMKQMDQSALQNDQMKMMKYMQYFMPVMFMFFFNNFASGLTCYLVFSNILNIGQTVVTKKYLINHEKIKDQLEKNRQKPRKTGGFRDRLEQAMKEQQRQANQQQKGKK